MCRRISVDLRKMCCALSLSLSLSLSRARARAKKAWHVRRIGRSTNGGLTDPLSSIAMLDVGPRCYENRGGDGEGEGGGGAEEPVARTGVSPGRGRTKGARLHEGGVSSNRRVSAACFNLTSLSASVPSAVARTLLASRLVQDTPVTRI